MYLTPDEEKILAGEFGEAKQIALKLLVDLGEFFNAEKLIAVDSAHISGVSYLTGGEGLIDQLELFVSKNAKVSIFSTLNPSGMDRNNYKDMYIDLEFATKQYRILQNFADLGVATTCSCTPYDFGHILTKGQHVAWAESSAVTFANSFFGARTNKEDSLSVLAAAIMGKTPYYGFHLAEHRVPNIKIKPEVELKEYADYSILGEIVGREFAKHSFPFGAIPLLTDLKQPRPQEFKTLGASLASFGTQLYHIEGISPEQELLSDAEFVDELIITEDMMKATYEELKPKDDFDLVVIGCPNANLEEIINVANLVRGKHLKEGKEFWLFSNAAHKALSISAGYMKTLEDAGVKFFVDTCPEVTPYNKEKFSKILTNSIKAQHYISAPSLNGIPTYLLSLRDCVEEAFE
ncbi:MAG: aconitase X catalytic domain-containing protein [Candidatus Heimdallarchaeota archaeon]|nr:aconitase X catalytic domain-containing protein [Candidatus Heimdallarchaeota archaeon]